MLPEGLGEGLAFVGREDLVGGMERCRKDRRRRSPEPDDIRATVNQGKLWSQDFPPHSLIDQGQRSRLQGGKIAGVPQRSRHTLYAQCLGDQECMKVARVCEDQDEGRSRSVPMHHLPARVGQG